MFEIAARRGRIRVPQLSLDGVQRNTICCKLGCVSVTKAMWVNALLDAGFPVQPPLKDGEALGVHSNGPLTPSFAVQDVDSALLGVNVLGTKEKILVVGHS